MVKYQIGKKEAIMGTGAGIGLVQTYLTRDVLDAMWGPIPVIGDYLGAWGSYSTFGNIAIGLVTFGLSAFTGVVKNDTARTFLQGYGFVCLLGGIFNGIFPSAQMSARLRLGRGASAGRMMAPPVSSPPMIQSTPRQSAPSADMLLV